MRGRVFDIVREMWTATLQAKEGEEAVRNTRRPAEKVEEAGRGGRAGRPRGPPLMIMCCKKPCFCNDLQWPCGGPGSTPEPAHDFYSVFVSAHDQV